jgi:hypothetical protein
LAARLVDHVAARILDALSVRVRVVSIVVERQTTHVILPPLLI